MQLAMACAVREPKDLIDFMFKPNVARVVMSDEKKVKNLAINEEEWMILFGAQAKPARTTYLERVISEQSFVTRVNKLQNALRTTVGETAQGKAWERPWTKASCLISMHFENHDKFLSASLGNVVRADNRRLEDIVTELDDDGVETMLVAQILASLAESVT